MPPEGEPLTPLQIQQLTEWISGGANRRLMSVPEPDPREHWAFQSGAPPEPPGLPRGGDAMPRCLHCRRTCGAWTATSNFGQAIGVDSTFVYRFAGICHQPFKIGTNVAQRDSGAGW